jgi:hypothetical protein
VTLHGVVWTCVRWSGSVEDDVRMPDTFGVFTNGRTYLCRRNLHELATAILVDALGPRKRGVPVGGVSRHVDQTRPGKSCTGRQDL